MTDRRNEAFLLFRAWRLCEGAEGEVETKEHAG